MIAINMPYRATLKALTTYILVAASVSCLIRVFPLTLIRGKIKNQFIRSFLYYVPYVTLAVMTFPAIIDAPQVPLSVRTRQLQIIP